MLASLNLTDIQLTALERDALNRALAFLPEGKQSLRGLVHFLRHNQHTWAPEGRGPYGRDTRYIAAGTRVANRVGAWR